MGYQDLQCSALIHCETNSCNSLCMRADSVHCLQTIVDTVERTVRAFMEQKGVQRAFA